MKTLRSSLLCATLLLCLVALPALAAKGPRIALVGSDGFPPLTDEDRALREVPFEKDADAVILLEQWQARWESRTDQVRIFRLDYYLRIKILEDRAGARYATRTLDVPRPWFIEAVEARTILPDGSEVPASVDIEDETGSDGLTPIGDKGTAEVRFEKAEAGSILDLHLEQRVWGITPFFATFQHEIPSMQAHVAAIPPEGVFMQIASLNIPRKELKKKTLRSTYGTGLSYSFFEIPSIPDEANRPHDREIARQLMVMLPERIERSERTLTASGADQVRAAQLDFGDDKFETATIFDYVEDWEGWNDLAYNSWKTWRRSTHVEVGKLAAKIASEHSDLRSRVEAVADAVAARVTITRESAQPLHAYPDAVLAEGNGTRGDAAGLAYTLLHEMEIESRLVMLRRRGDGRIPPGFPVPRLLDAVYVEVPVSDARLYVVPGSALGIETLPRDYRGVASIPIDGKTDAVRPTPDYSADENRSERTVEMKLDPDGGVSGSATILSYGVAGEVLRSEVRGLDAPALATRFAPLFEGLLEDVQVEGVSLHALDVPSRPLTVRVRFKGTLPPLGEPGVRAYRPHSLDPVPADAWPEAERTLELDLEEPVQVLDTLILELPENAKTGPAPENKSLDAPPVGRYGVGYRIEPRRITSQRLYRLDSYLFPADAYKGLSRWFRDMAETDTATVAITLPK